VHEDVEQRDSQEQEPWEGAVEMGAVLGDEKEGSDCGEGDKEQ